MGLIRSTLLVCFTALMCVGAMTFVEHQKNRFEILKAEEGLFIFDRHTGGTNFCSGGASGQCTALGYSFLPVPRPVTSILPGVSPTSLEDSGPSQPQKALKKTKTSGPSTDEEQDEPE